MKGNVSWVVVLRSCAERNNVDIDHKNCSDIADELVLRGKIIKEKDREIADLKSGATVMALTLQIAELKGSIDRAVEGMNELAATVPEEKERDKYIGIAVIIRSLNREPEETKSKEDKR